MDKLDREKFDLIRTNDEIWYLDSGGCRCNATVVGWKNVAGDPAPLVGQHGDRAIPLDSIISRTRGSDTKEWPVDKDKDKPRAESLM